MMGRAEAPAPPVDPSAINLREIAEIELFVLRRMKELTMGDHASVFKFTLHHNGRATIKGVARNEANLTG